MKKIVQKKDEKNTSNMKQMQHAEMKKTDVTKLELFAITILSVLSLLAAVLWSSNFTNLRIWAKDVRRVVMPKGMTNFWDLPAEAMVDMSAVDVRRIDYSAPVTARGDQLLEPRIEDGVKVFDLDVSPIEWYILPYVKAGAYAFNKQVPGPRIRITEGDKVRINVKNNLTESTTVHWHGLMLPNRFDGPAEITQKPIEPGDSYTYEFVAQQKGTFFYHSHDHADRQQALGMYGALIIDPKNPREDESLGYSKEVVIQLQEWLFREGYTFPAMPMDGMQPNFFTINGKSYPETETVNVKVGEKVRIRFIGSQSGFIHPMHIHGGPFKIVETDGAKVDPSAQLLKDTINVAPGERYDVIWEATEPGKWILHCHINHHTTNNNIEEQGAGGLTMIFNVEP